MYLRPESPADVSLAGRVFTCRFSLFCFFSPYFNCWAEKFKMFEGFDLQKKKRDPQDELVLWSCVREF